ncbi:MAG TPA: TatD family hydrolase [Nitrososphaerales archaeon]|nr:TatD family hydrolase [Nitrososphaerales archaeon]
MRFVDSHLHLYEPEAVRKVKLAESTRIMLLTCGEDRETSSVALRLSKAYPETVKAFIGLHPSKALEATSLDWLEQDLGWASGVGEVGLDPKYSETGPGSNQMKALRAQLELAQAAGKPVQVHSRDAERECVDTLGGFTLSSVLLHWFQGEELLQEVVGRGYFVSFGPALLYSKKLQRMATRSPQGHVLAETDSPVPFGPLGGVHGSSLIPSVVFKLSELWREGFEDARATLAGNALRFLGLSEKG